MNSFIYRSYQFKKLKFEKLNRFIALDKFETIKYLRRTGSSATYVCFEGQYYSTSAGKERVVEKFWNRNFSEVYPDAQTLEFYGQNKIMGTCKPSKLWIAKNVPTTVLKNICKCMHLYIFSNVFGSLNLVEKKCETFTFTYILREPNRILCSTEMKLIKFKQTRLC